MGNRLRKLGIVVSVSTSAREEWEAHWCMNATMLLAYVLYHRVSVVERKPKPRRIHMHLEYVDGS